MEQGPPLPDSDSDDDDADEDEDKVVAGKSADPATPDICLR